MLKINELHTGYGKKPVLFGPSLEVNKGEIIAIIGPNGAGKSTILKAVCGLIPVWDGEIAFEGFCINGSTPAKNVKRGITFCPQGNRVFDELSVSENLQIGGIHLKKKELAARIDEVLELLLPDYARSLLQICPVLEYQSVLKVSALSLQERYPLPVHPEVINLLLKQGSIPGSKVSAVHMKDRMPDH